MQILDIGCGSGSTALEFTKFGTVYGTDFSFTALKYAVKEEFLMLYRVILMSYHPNPYSYYSSSRK